ncbi:uncharacterized [Tachysurus ichikawai]
MRTLSNNFAAAAFADWCTITNLSLGGRINQIKEAKLKGNAVRRASFPKTTRRIRFIWLHNPSVSETCFQAWHLDFFISIH